MYAAAVYDSGWELGMSDADLQDCLPPDPEQLVRLTADKETGMRKVLVLEDEENIRSFVVINLKRAGYETISRHR